MSMSASRLASGPAKRENSNCALVGELTVKVSPSADVHIDLDLVVVHGLHRATSNIPKSDGDDFATSLQSTFENHTGRAVRLMAYSYHPTNLSLWKIRQEASNLLSTLRSLRAVAVGESENEEVPQPIVFICQDIGGLIVKAALIQAMSTTRSADTIAGSVRGLVFVACPHRHEGPHSLEDQLLYLLQGSELAPPDQSLPALTQNLAITTKQINGEFIHTKLILSSVCVTVFSTRTNPPEQVFDAYTVTLNTPFETAIGINSPHKGLVESLLLDSSSPAFKTFSEVAERSWTLRTVQTPKTMALLQTLAAISSPVYPPEEVPDVDSAISGYHGCVDEFKTTTNNQVLHISAKTDVETLLLTRGLIRYISNSATPSPTSVLHFTFQRNDVRFNNILSMLGTFLAHLVFKNISEKGHLVFTVLLDTAEYRGWTADDLFALWRRFRLNKMDHEVVYVLGNIEQCDKSKKDFLRWLKFMAAQTEMPLKVAITSTAGADSGVEEAFNSCASDIYKSVTVSGQGGFTSILPRGGSTLLIDRPLSQLPSRYMHWEPELTHLFAHVARSDALLHQITADWLRHTSLAVKDIKVVLSRLGATNLAGGLATLLGLIPANRQLWSRRLLSFACASVRPLRVMELCAASYIADRLPDTHGTPDSTVAEFNLQDHLDDILQWLGGLLVLRNDEFHLRESSLGGALRSRLQWTETQQHRDILDVCTAHVRQSSDIESRKIGPVEGPGFPENLASSCSLVSLADAMPYATQYWSRHYKFLRLSSNSPAPSITELDARTSEFLREDTSQDPLLASAELGLSHLVGNFLPAFSSALAGSALVAAAKNGHAEVVKTLLESSGESFKTDWTILLHAARVASLSENAESFRLIVQHLAKAQTRAPDPRSTLPPALMFRAAWLGLDDTAEALLGLGLSPTPDGLDDHISPLHATVVLDRVSALQALIRGGGDPTVKTSTVGSSPLHHACLYGSAKCVEELLRMSHSHPGISEPGDDGSHALSYAVKFGNFEVAEILLKHDRHRKRTQADYKEEYAAALKDATENNHRRGVELLLRYDADPSFGLSSSMSPLQRAIWNGRTDICTLLVEANADVNDGRGGWVPLIIAAEQGDAAIVSLLLGRGASVNAVEPNTGRSAIHVAASSGRTSVIQVLLAADANIEGRDEYSCTPIWLAARNNHTDAVEILAKAGADVNTVSGWFDWTPLHVAYDFPEVTRVLLEYHADVDSIGNGRTPLRLATQDCQLEVMKLLLEKGASLEKSIDDGETLFAIAVRFGYGNVEALRALLEAGEDINQRIGSTFAMKYAIKRKDSAMVKLLLEFSPDLGRRDNHGQTFLHGITEDTPMESVQRLVNAGADPNAEDMGGHTALCTAIFSRNAEVVSYLLKCRTVDRHTITHHPSHRQFGFVNHAARSSAVDVLRLLAEAGEDMIAISTTYGGLVSAACYPFKSAPGNNGEVSTIRYLIDEAKADVNAKGGLLGYAINMAAARSGREVIGILLTAGAGLDKSDAYGRAPIHLACQNQLQALKALKVPDDEFKRKDSFGRLPLHFAAVSGRVDLARYVLERSRLVGIEIDVVDHHGWTALMWAARTPSSMWPSKPDANKDDHEHVIKLFLDETADPSARGEVPDGEKWTPLEIATYHGASDKVIGLLSAGPDSSSPSGRPKQRIGVEQDPFCDGCLVYLCGYYHRCLTCGDSDLCFKCYQSKEVHKCDQDWILKGEELSIDVVESTAQSPDQVMKDEMYFTSDPGSESEGTRSDFFIMMESDEET